MKHLSDCIFCFLTVIFVVLFTPVYPEVLAPPPLAITTAQKGSILPNDSQRPVFMPGGITWLMLKRISDDSGIQQPDTGTSHNYVYDLGSDFIFLRWQKMSLEGMVRMVFLSAQPAGWSSNTWLIDSSAMVVEQNLRLGFHFLNGSHFSIGFHHNSKHDLDRPRRRTPIHDTLRFDLGSPWFHGSWNRDSVTNTGSLFQKTLASPGWGAFLNGRVEYVLPSVFQFDAPEPYAGGIFVTSEIQPLILKNGTEFFTSARASLLFHSYEGQRYSDLDWLIRTGMRLNGKSGGLGIFGEVHRLHDDWISRDSIGPVRKTDPWTLISLGLMMWR